ncbi:MAG: NitT/TauT family transport system substrate-binding protein [Solirubrobacteraceae bacterium]
MSVEDAKDMQRPNLSVSRRGLLRSAAALGAGGVTLAACGGGGGTKSAADAQAATTSPATGRPGIATGNEVITDRKQRHTVRINQAFQSLLYLTLYIANDVGFFDEEGVELKLSTGGGGSQAWAAVLAGSADYSIQDPIFPSISLERGQNKGVVVGSIANGMACLAVAKDPAIVRATDAKQFMTKVVPGKRVVTQPEPDSAWAQMKYLGDLYGVKAGEDFEILQVPLGTEPAPVLQGRADIAIGWPPSVDLSLGKGLHEVFDFSRFWGPFALSGLTTTRDYVKNSPVAHQGVMNALEKASQYAYAYPDQAIKIAQREFKDEDPELVASSARRMLERLIIPQHLLVEQIAWDNDQFANFYAKSVKKTHPLDRGVDNRAPVQSYRQLGYGALTQWKQPRQIVSTVASQ